VGRYANRIKNGTFSVDGHSYHISENENGGRDTLHGGVVGYGTSHFPCSDWPTTHTFADLRNWTIAAQTSSSVTFTLTDNGLEGFPGTVKTSVSYALEKGGKWDIKMHSTASQKTPIMLAGHQYWNLEAYEESQDLLGHYAQFDASRVIAGDGILIPNGTLFNVTGTPLDFHKAKSIGVSLYETTPYQYCGTGM
jgi:aldose 1-epimerase